MSSTTLTPAQLHEVQWMIEERVKPLEEAIRTLEQRMREVQDRPIAGLARVALPDRRSMPQVQEDDARDEPLGHDWYDEADLWADYH